MRNPQRVLDKTFLSADNADERVIRHRDVNSHAFRWAHVARYLQQNHHYKDAVILDAGCGKEAPLAKMLYSNRLITKGYVGVDANAFDIPEMLKGKKLPVRIWEKTDFCALNELDVSFTDEANPSGPMLRPNIVVCMEVAEHCLPSHTRRMIKHFLDLSTEDAHYFVSTPCWDRVNAAENHLNEMTATAFGALLEDLGYQIVGYWGTFASQKDYKHIMEERYPGITKIFNDLSEYYDSTVISTTFAPLFPMESRNCLWHLTRATAGYQRKFPLLVDCETPWTQHPTWRELAGGELPRAEQTHEGAQGA